jgi:type II secretory pathway component GspD/PulD (secretin)/tetratricopeptide (TPR) repeat protein
VACVLLANPIFFSNAQDKADAIAGEVISKEVQSVSAGRVEQALKQQKELQGDNLKMSAEKAYKEGDYAQAIEDYLQAVDKYKRVSSSEPRVLSKLKDSNTMLGRTYKKHAEVLLKKAESEASVNLFEQADALLLKALEFTPELDQYISKRRAELSVSKLAAERAEAVDASGLKRQAAIRKEEKQWRIEQSQILFANRRFIDAKSILEEVLIIDPFDSKAATLIRRVNEKLFLSGRARRIATVQERIDEVEWKWSLPIHNEAFNGPDNIADEGKIPLSSEVAAISEKLKIIIPRFTQNTTIEEVLSALKETSIEQDPDKKGITIIYRPKPKTSVAEDVADPEADDGALDEDDPFAADEEEVAFDAEPGEDAQAGNGADKIYNFDFENMPIGEIIRYICISSNLKYKIDSYAIIIAHPSVQIDEMVTRFYPVNSSVFAALSDNAPASSGGELDLGGGLDDIGGGDEGGGDGQKVRKYLEAMGVQFPAGAQVAYLQGVSRLVVTDTVTEQRRIQEILNQLQVEAAQVIIESKFVEINQKNLDEFGFQWSLQTTSTHDNSLNFIPNLEQLEIEGVAAANNTLQDIFINGSSEFLVDGVTGAITGPFLISGSDGVPDIDENGQNIVDVNNDFINGVDTGSQFGGLLGSPNGLIQPIADVVGVNASSLFPNAGTIGTSGIPTTGGLGTVALGGLSSGIRDVSSLLGQTQQGQLSFTSVIGDNQFNTVIRALSQQSNNDILSAPKVITQNGSTAIIRVVDERFFPESWEPPTITVVTGGEDNGTQVLSIQPSLPNFGDARDLGVVLEVTPQVDPDGVSIEIELKPQVVQFVGLDTSFNSPIFVADFGNPAAVSRYDMPIISSRSIDTRVKVWDGETVVLGGLIQETVTMVNDRVPILADIPLVGWLFENKGENRQKQNLLIFVSARLVNNAGLPIRENDIRGLPDFKRL